MRFNLNATTQDEAAEYIKNRAMQLLRLGYVLDYDSIRMYEWGVSVYFTKGLQSFQVLYLLDQFRGQGIYKKNVKETILTSFQCGLQDYLDKHKISYVIENLNPYIEYDFISKYYGDTKATRSGVYYMNHIDEGLAILEAIGASETAKRAFCLHPVLQTDEDLKTNYGKYIAYSYENVLIAAMEYRSVANEYLSNRVIKSIDEIRLPPLKDVNDMLIADKVQNYKDFELYHFGKHSRSNELVEYFDNWIEKLGVDYKRLKKIIC